jgi:hypothetical protein
MFPVLAPSPTGWRLAPCRSLPGLQQPYVPSRLRTGCGVLCKVYEYKLHYTQAQKLELITDLVFSDLTRNTAVFWQEALVKHPSILT